MKIAIEETKVVLIRKGIVKMLTKRKEFMVMHSKYSSSIRQWLTLKVFKRLLKIKRLYILKYLVNSILPRLLEKQLLIKT